MHQLGTPHRHSCGGARSHAPAIQVRSLFHPFQLPATEVMNNWIFFNHLPSVHPPLLPPLASILPFSGDHRHSPVLARSPKISNTFFLNSGEMLGMLRCVAKIVLLKRIIPLLSLKNNSRVLHSQVQTILSVLFCETKTYCLTCPNILRNDFRDQAVFTLEQNI